jgi:hypothetical protein
MNKPFCNDQTEREIEHRRKDLKEEEEEERRTWENRLAKTFFQNEER